MGEAARQGGVGGEGGEERVAWVRRRREVGEIVFVRERDLYVLDVYII